MKKILSHKQFNILTCLEKNSNKNLKQREISDITGMSLGSVNTTLNDLISLGFVENSKITQSGLDALEPYRVKRAIFIAAGFGSRLVPITLNTPKPLVRVKGVRMIDTLLDAVTKAGIEDIIIVRGYLAEQFDQLLYKYPNIRFIDNPLYSEANNICSAMQVRSLIKNSYMMDADLVLHNPDLVQKYQYSSNYLGIPVKKTDDWCLTSKNKIITGMKIGGTDCHHMLGFSYWTEEDGKNLEKDIESVYNMPGGKERYWDQVALEFFNQNYKVEIRECNENDIVEIDTYSALKEIDSSYCR